MSNSAEAYSSFEQAHILWTPSATLPVAFQLACTQHGSLSNTKGKNPFLLFINPKNIFRLLSVGIDISSDLIWHGHVLVLVVGAGQISVTNRE